MINLTDLPIIKLQKHEEARLASQIRQKLIDEGRAARRANLPITRCPKFVDPDMAINWEMGWRWEDKDILAQTKK